METGICTGHWVAHSTLPSGPHDLQHRCRSCKCRNVEMNACPGQQDPRYRAWVPFGTSNPAPCFAAGSTPQGCYRQTCRGRTKLSNFLLWKVAKSSFRAFSNDIISNDAAVSSTSYCEGQNGKNKKHHRLLSPQRAGCLEGLAQAQWRAQIFAQSSSKEKRVCACSASGTW